MKCGELPLKPLFPPGINRASLPKGSPEWCWMTVSLAKRRWERVETTENEWKEVLGDLALCVGRIPEDHPYRELDDLLKREIGVNETESRNTIVLRARGAPEGNQNAKKNKEPIEQNKGSIRTFKRGDGHREYLTARITRDHPTIAERLERGEFRSVRQAALEAGIVQRMIQVPHDPVKAAKLLARHFSLDEFNRLVTAARAWYANPKG